MQPSHSRDPWKDSRIPVRASGTNPAKEQLGQAVLRDPIRYAPGAPGEHRDLSTLHFGSWRQAGPASSAR